MASTVSTAAPTRRDLVARVMSVAREIVRQRTELADMGERIRDHLLIDDSDRFGDPASRRLPNECRSTCARRLRTGHAGVARCSAIELPPSTTRYCPVM
jgi:hypothetical protein